MTPCIDIVIVNWNAGSQLEIVVNSISSYHGGFVDSVIIVDNDSADNSLDIIKSKLLTYPFNVRIARNDKNIGFGAACNQGAILSNSEFLLFLNPDAQLYKNSLEEPVKFLTHAENADVGIVGIQLLDQNGIISMSCSRFPSLTTFAAQAIGLNRIPLFSAMSLHMSDWKHDTTRQVDHVIGAFYFIRRPLFQSLGGFDERFFVYLEDLDLSLRASKIGFKSFFLADTRAFHSGGGTSQQVQAHRLFYSLRSRILYGFKHFSKWKAWALMFVTLAIEPVTRTVFAAISGCEGISNTWRGYCMLYRDLPQILKRVRHS